MNACRFHVLVTVTLDAAATWADAAYALNRAAGDVFAEAAERAVSPFAPLAEQPGDVVVEPHEVAHRDLHVVGCALEIQRAMRPPGDGG